jgi:ADP-heptose:LPS heptosyltransferase
MNFPGLDPAWSGVHDALRGLGVIRPWTLPETRAALDRGEKVLVVASTALGDSILTTPLIETLSQRLGRDRVSLLVKAPYADLYKSDPRLRRVFSVRGKYRWSNLRREMQQLGKKVDIYGGTTSRSSAARQELGPPGKPEPHRIALLSNLTEPDLIPWLWYCGVRGFLRYRTRWTCYPRWIANADMLRQPGAPDYATGHAIENNLAMAGALGLEPVTHCLSLPHLQTGAGSRERRILIHPGASRDIKKWPVENWARLADALADKFDCAIAITGDDREAALANEVTAMMKSPVQVLAGKLSLAGLARAQSRALAFLSGDTGPYHLAVAVGCPTVTLFAPTDRGSSMEACGPHRADPHFHRALQTANPGDSISTISYERVLIEASAVVGSCSASLPG